MKKVLAAVLAAAMSLSMASVAFAAITGDLGEATGSSKGSTYKVLSSVKDKESYTVKDADGKKVTLYNRKSEALEINFEIAPYKFSKIDVHVASGDIKVKKTKLDDDNMRITITPNYGVKDWKGGDWSVDVEVEKANDANPGKTFTLKGEGAYSAVQTVYSGAKLRVSDSGYTVSKGKDSDSKVGCFFSFDEVLEDTTRIRCHEYVDVYFKGNYGTDVENMYVSTDVPDEVKEYFDDADVDCYDFIGTPKFATSVEVIIDADKNTTIYEYNKSTGDLTRVDTTDYTSDGWKFKAKTLGCYILTEEEYDEGNAKDEPTKEPVSEPTETTDKSNPGTGANDMVGAAAALAVVSLVAAGAVAFKKASK